MSSTELDLLRQLKTELISFMDELIETFPEQTDFVIFRIFLNDQIPITDIMGYIVKKILPLKPLIVERDEKVIEKNNILFEKFDEEKNSKVNYFKNLWNSPRIDKDDKKIIWEWLDTFVYLAEKYKEITQ